MEIYRYKKMSYTYSSDVDLVFTLSYYIKTKIKEKDIKIITENNLQNTVESILITLGNDYGDILKLDWNNRCIPDNIDNTLLIIIGTESFIKEKNNLLNLNGYSIEIISCFLFEEVRKKISDIKNEYGNSIKISEENVDIQKAQRGEQDEVTKLIQIYNWLIWTVAKKVSEIGYELEDLYKIGCLGFVKAINRFDETMELMDFAIPYILIEIAQFIKSKNENNFMEDEQLEELCIIEKNSTNNIFNELLEYKKLFDEGVITEEEFSQKKKKLMEI